MQAIEIETEIDENHEIHVKLPDNVASGSAKVIVLFGGRTEKTHNPLKLGLFEGQIQISDDFDDQLPDEFWLGDKP